MKSSYIWKFAVLQSIVVLLIIITGCNNVDYWPPAYQTHDVVEQFKVEEKWRLSSVLVPQDYAGPLLQSDLGKLFLIGSLTPKEVRKLHVLDAKTGSEEFVIPGHSSAFAVKNNIIVMGQSGFGRVLAFQLDDNGYKQIWEKGLPKSHALLYLSFPGDTVQTHYTPDVFYVLNLEGEILESYSERADAIFLLENEISYAREVILNRLTARNVKTDERIWEVVFDKEYLQAPVFTQEIIFVKTERVIGSLYAVDKASGTMLWQTGHDIVGNITVSQKYVFALTKDGRIIRIDIETGQAETLVQFSNLPFILDGDEWVNGYYVSFDKATNMLAVVLGDSQQMFGFYVAE